MLDKLKTRLANMMRGRYGMDALYKATMALTFVFLVLNLLFPSPVFYLLSLVCAFLSIFRAFSKNHAKRAAENQKYLGFKGRFSKAVLQLKNRFRDRKTHRYRACPNCKQSLRLKKKIGVNHVRCPMCKHEFDITIKM